MAWFSRFRLLVPILLVPAGYLVHRLLDTSQFNLPAIGVVAMCTIPMTVASLLLLMRWRSDVQRRGRELEALVSAQTIWDIVFTSIGIHYAGGVSGPFWPFPLVPVIVASTLLPSIRMLALHSAVAILSITALAWSGGIVHLVAPIMLTLMFLSFSAFISTSVSGRLTVLRTQRRELDRLRADKELAEAVARRREEILSVVSHELASPLMTLRGYVRLLQEQKGRDRGSAHLLERIDRQVGRLSGLAEDLLEMASTRAGALRLKRASFELSELLLDVRESARIQFPDAVITFTGDAGIIGVWDRDRLDQLFGNLFSNAVKFAGARCTVDFDVRREGQNQVHMTVTDNGPGISADALRRIFEPFQRYSAERGGLGLGLAIARAIVELHEGRIWAESPDGRGASFHVVLPTDAKPSAQQPVIGPIRVPA